MFAYRVLVVGALLSCGLAMPPIAYGANPKASATPLKVYISVDMEGVAGVVTGDQLMPGGFEY
jgi:hypothetical protein